MSRAVVGGGRASREAGPPRTVGDEVDRRVATVPRRIDLRLLLPVLVAWPVVAFVGLVAPVVAVSAAGVGLLISACGLTAPASTVHGAPRQPGSLRWRVRSGSSRRRLMVLVLAVCSLCLLAAAAQRSMRTSGPVDELAADQAVVTIRGQVAAEPRPVTSGPGLTGRGPEATRVLVRVDVAEVEGRGVRTPVASPVLVMAEGDWSRVRWHERVEAVVRLRPADPGDDVVAVASPMSGPRVLAPPGALFRAADGARESFRAATAGLPADARGLVPALVIGDTSRTPPDLTEAMLATGMSHLSAVSGSNVTLVLGAALGLCRLAGVRRRARPVVALAVLTAFVVLARPEPSVVRAAVMGTVGLLALSTSRRQAGVPALAGAVAALLVWDPWLSRSFGFALSSAATLGLLVFAQPWGRAIARVLPARLVWLGPVLAVPVAAQAVCAPIVVPLQGSVSFIAVPANLLAAPLVAPTTIIGVVVALTSVVWVSGAAALAWGAGLPALGIAWVARRCAEVPFGDVPSSDSALGAVALAVATVLVILIWPWAWHRSRLRPLVALAVVALTAAFVTPTSLVAWPPPGWVFVACDVGQGDGLVVSTGPGRALVVDAGPEPAVMRACLDRLDIRVVDLVVLTHFHADHVGGLAGVLAGRSVAEIRVSPVRDPEAEAVRVAQLAAAHDVPVGELRAGDSFAVDDVRADVWWPARQISAGSVANNGSVVLTVHVRGASILLSGDIEREAAAQVVRAARQDPQRWGTVDVLKVAHHGSSNRDDRLLDVVGPGLALVSVGADNDYGHPAPALLAALQQRGQRVHRTDLEGDIAVVVDERGVHGVGSR